MRITIETDVGKTMYDTDKARDLLVYMLDSGLINEEICARWERTVSELEDKFLEEDYEGG